MAYIIARMVRAALAEAARLTQQTALQRHGPREADLAQRRQAGPEVGVARPRLLAVAVGQVDVRHIWRRGADRGCDVGLLDVYVEEVGHHAHRGQLHCPAQRGGLRQHLVGRAVLARGRRAV
jgi:hypothetical protein